MGSSRTEIWNRREGHSSSRQEKESPAGVLCDVARTGRRVGRRYYSYKSEVNVVRQADLKPLASPKIDQWKTSLKVEALNSANTGTSIKRSG